MAKYKWQGVDKGGKKITGVVDAVSKKDARKILKLKNIKVKNIKDPSILDFDIGEWMVESGFVAPFGSKELTGFTKRLSIMINAGIPILQALEILYKQESHPILKDTIRRIASDVGEGMNLADALEKQKGFDSLYCNLVRAGEAAGILDTILEKLTIHMDKQRKTQSQIKGAMIYPISVVIVGIGVVIFMLIFVVPQFQSMMAQNEQEVPLPTQMVIDASKFLQDNMKLLFFGFIALIIGFRIFKKTSDGKRIVDTILLKMPVFGGIILKGNLTSFTRTLSTMLSAGVSLTDALDICERTIGNIVIQTDVKTLRSAVLQGKTLTEPLLKIPYFPPMVGQMVKVGEQTGGLDTMLMKVAGVFEEEVDNLVSAMTKMIEPFVLVFLGGAVGFILIAMYLPIFKAAG